MNLEFSRVMAAHLLSVAEILRLLEGDDSDLSDFDFACEAVDVGENAEMIISKLSPDSEEQRCVEEVVSTGGRPRVCPHFSTVIVKLKT